MLYRKTLEKLRAWKNEPNKKALCIVGARQIGKTTIVREFAKEAYTNFLELNFITDPQVGKIFGDSLSAEVLLENITAYARRPLPKGKTLILLDEIQECLNARTAIKFLVEDGSFDYIATGSLLGTRYKEIKSFPVGFEELYHMYPMDFEEFLLANNVQKETFNYLRQCFDSLQPVSESVHETLLKLFQTYIVVGGMPRIVQTYIDTHDIGLVLQEQRNILEQYRLDITKYSSKKNKTKITAIFDNIPAQLDDKNRRFMVGQIDKNGRMGRYEESFKWLEDAGVALPCYNVVAPKAPLTLNTKYNLFKLYFGDIGLLCAASMNNVQLEILQGNLKINLGSILENVIAQQLKANGFGLNYFNSKKYGEIDFVVQRGQDIDVLEIKSGNEYKKHNALRNVLAVEDWKIHKAMVFCKGNIEEVDGVLYFPWYMSMFLHTKDISVGTFHIVDTSGL